MITGLSIIAYMAALFILLLGIAFAILIISRKEYRSSHLYQTIGIFAAVVMVYCGLYMYFYFRDVAMMNYAVGLPLRLFDYLLFGSLPLLWMRVIGLLARQDAGAGSSARSSRVFLWSWILGIAQILTGMTGSCLMNDYYGFSSHVAGTAFVMAETLLTLACVIVIGYYSFTFIHSSVITLQRRYVGFTSIVFCLWFCFQQAVDTGLYLNWFVSAWAEGIPDTTAFSAFLMGLATFIFIFRADFSPIFYAPTGLTADPDSTGQPDESGEAAPADPLELAAAQHGLTVRELDVLRLVYEGKNNPEIAEELFISRNTVKKHLQNIYEKTGVNNRMELIYIVNLKRDQA